MPWAGKLEPGDFQRVHVLGDGHVFIDPPTPLRVPSEEIVDESLHDLTVSPAPPTDRILERVVRLRPGILLADGCRGLEQRPSRTKSRGDFRLQLPREGGDRLLDVDVAAVHPLLPEEVRELLENVSLDHG